MKHRLPTSGHLLLLVLACSLFYFYKEAAHGLIGWAASLGGGMEVKYLLFYRFIHHEQPTVESAAAAWSVEEHFPH